MLPIDASLLPLRDSSAKRALFERMGAALLAFGLLAGLVACGSNDDGAAGSGGALGTSGTGASSAKASGSGGGPDNGTTGTGTPPFMGVPIKVVTGVETALPELPALTNITGQVIDDNVELTFDPVDGAVDYRIYPLPQDGDITVVNGAVTIKNAIYRCAGDLEEPPVASDDGANDALFPANEEQSAVTTTIVKSAVNGYTRTMDEATLGYVYIAPDKGLIPVWALGNPDNRADTTYSCLWGGWQASRVKTYTSSQAEHDMLVSQGWRDDGIQFYVPSAASGTTKTVYTGTDETPGAMFYSKYYFTSAAELAARASVKPTPANFVVLATAAPGTQPLMRVWYASACSAAHDELAVGKTRFDNIYHQGLYPVTTLSWSGIAKPTVLVVEALAGGCPYQGMLSARHIDSATTCDVVSAPVGNCMNGFKSVTYDPFLTLSDMQAASPTGEVFVNGQHDTMALPKAIARSFVQVEPQDAPKLDFFDGFHVDKTFTYSPFVLSPPPFNFASFDMSNDTYDLEIYDVEDNGKGTDQLFSAGTFLGQLWVDFADGGADTNGKFRLEPKKLAAVGADTFLHVTMQTDSVTTRRRYPQIIVTDQAHPVQETMKGGYSVVVEPIISWPPILEIQFCDHTMWDVNAQCNYYELFHSTLAPADAALPLPPVPNFPQRTSTDRPNRYDVYLSTSRVYLLLDGQPYGCADLPANTWKPGAAAVAFGNVLYHSGADVAVPPNGGGIDWIYPFHAKHLTYVTRAHYDNLGFASGVAAPEWNTKVIPCQTTLRDFDTGKPVQ